MGPSFAEVARCSGAGELGRGRGGRPRRVDPDASLADASARFPGSAEERRFGSDGPGAWGAADRRPAPSRASGRGRRLQPSRGVFRRLGGAQSLLRSVLQAGPRGLEGRVLRRFRMAFGPGFELMSDKVTLSDIAYPTTSGADQSRKQVTKRRRRFTMPT